VVYVICVLIVFMVELVEWRGNGIFFCGRESVVVVSVTIVNMWRDSGLLRGRERSGGGIRVILLVVHLNCHRISNLQPQRQERDSPIHQFFFDVSVTRFTCILAVARWCGTGAAMGKPADGPGELKLELRALGYGM
jgi:hypothetical protein